MISKVHVKSIKCVLKVQTILRMFTSNKLNFVLLVGILIHTIFACKNGRSSGKKKSDGKADTEIPKINNTHFNMTTIKKFHGKQFVSELWNQEELQERILLHSVYEVTVSSRTKEFDHHYHPTALDLKLFLLSNKKQPIQLLDLRVSINIKLKVLQYDLKSAIPEQNSTFTINMSKGSKNIDPNILENHLNMTVFVLFDFQSFNFAWCASIGTDPKEIVHCFLSNNFESFYAALDLLNGRISLSIERGGDIEKSCTTIDSITIAHNSLTATFKESSKNKLQNSTFAEEILKNKDIVKQFSDQTNLFIPKHFSSLHCKKSSVNCNFGTNKNLFCFNETVNCPDYQMSNYYWKVLQKATFIDLSEINLAALKYITITSKGLTVGKFQMIDGHQNDVSFVSIDSEFNNITGIQKYNISSNEFQGSFSPNVAEFREVFLKFIIEIPDNNSPCPRGEHAKLYVAIQEATVITNLELFGKIRIDTWNWKGININGFKSGFEVMMETILVKHAQMRYNSSIIDIDAANFHLKCQQHPARNDSKNVLHSTLIFTIVVVLVIICLTLLVVMVYKMARKKSTKKGKTMPIANVADGNHESSKSSDEYYDDAIDVDAIEESAYATELPAEINDHPICEKHYSNNAVENNDIATYSNLMSNEES